MTWTFEERAICIAYIGRTPVKHILERFNLNPRNLYVLLRRAGIPLRGAHHQEYRNEAIAKARFAGAAIPDLAEQYQLSCERIRQIVRISGAVRINEQV